MQLALQLPHGELEKEMAMDAPLNVDNHHLQLHLLLADGAYA